MWTVIAWLKKNLVWSIPMFMVAGLVFGAIANPAFLKSAIIPLTFLMVYPDGVCEGQRQCSGQNDRDRSDFGIVGHAILRPVAHGHRGRNPDGVGV